jgi:hypothetical protein
VDVDQQSLHLGVVEIELGHAFIEAAGAHERGDFGVGMGSDEGENARRAICPVGIAAVTDGAMADKSSGGRLLAERRRSRE